MASVEHPDATAGRIDALVGPVFVLKLDGVQVPAVNGGAVQDGDIVVTRAGGSASLAFGATIVLLGADARLLVEAGGAHPVFFVLQGPFGIQSETPPNTADQVTVRTPVATALLRQGRMLGRAAAEAVSNAFVLLPGPDGQAGHLTVTTAQGSLTLDRPLQGTSVVSLFRSPMPAAERDAASLAGEFGGMLATWLPSITGPVAQADVPLPELLAALAGQTGDFLLQRGAKLLSALIPPAAAAQPIELREAVPVDHTLITASDHTLITTSTPAILTTPQVFSFSFGQGSASFRGGTGNDLIVLAADPLNANTISFSTDAQNRVVISDGLGHQVLLSGIEEIELSLGLVSDVVRLGDLSQTDIADNTVIIHAGDGDDTIDASLAGKRVVLFGDAGNDLLIGGAKNDDLHGGTGDDTLVGGPGNDLLDGGPGIDTVSYAAALGPVVVNLAAGTATGDGSDTLISIENVIGSAFADTLIGDAGPNLLQGGPGDDLLIGNGGDDILDGGPGSDTVSFALLGHGVTVSLADGMAGADGTETLISIENVIGSALADIITGDDGPNQLQGGPGDDLLIGNGGDDILDGGPGGDTVSYAAAPGPVVVNLAAGTATGDGSGTLLLIENVTGSAFADTIIGEAGPNWLQGGPGDDLLIGNGGDDTLDGGAGSDTVSFALLGHGVIVALADGTVSADGTESLISIENVIGSAFADMITGDDGPNVISGGLGNDTLDGRGGDDRFDWFSGTGNDTIIGGSGTDRLEAEVTGTTHLARDRGAVLLTDNGTARASDVEMFHLFSRDPGTGLSLVIDNLSGLLGDGSISVTGSPSGDLLDARASRIGVKLDGGAGNDLIIGGHGDDVLIGGAGIDTVSFVGAAHGVSVDLAAGTANGDGTDSLQGFENIVGSDRSDTLRGDDGANVITGGGGEDTLVGGLGADLLTGSPGDAQVFAYNAPSEGGDTIVSFETGLDQIRFNIGAFQIATVQDSGPQQNFFDAAIGNPLGTTNPVFLFDQATGILAYDRNGNDPAAAVVLAMVQTGTIQASDLHPALNTF